MNEEPIFRQGDIVISKTLAQFGGITYPINGIGSVYVAKPKRAGLIIFGSIAGFIGSVLLSEPNSREGGWIFLGFGILLIIVAIGKPHRLMLRTASGDQQAYEARNAPELLEIKSAIERAVTLRG